MNKILRAPQVCAADTVLVFRASSLMHIQGRTRRVGSKGFCGVLGRKIKIDDAVSTWHPKPIVFEPGQRVNKRRPLLIR